MTITREERFIGPQGGPARTVQVTHYKRRVVSKTNPQEMVTDPKSKKTKLLPKKQHTVHIR